MVNIAFSRLRSLQASTSLLFLFNQNGSASAFNHSAKPTAFQPSNSFASSFHNGKTNNKFQASSVSLKAEAEPSASESTTIFERVLENPKWPPEWPFTEKDFARQDESDDGYFYESPRL